MSFQDIHGNSYTVDIYKGGYNASATPVLLQAASDPLRIEYSCGDDFFAPVESMSGSLRIIDDGRVDITELLPESNTDRLVYIVAQQANIQYWAFLSAEQYTQDYNGRVHEIELPLIGVLDAMDSVEIPQALFGMQSMRALIGTLLGYFLKNYVNPALCYVYIPYECIEVLKCRVDTSILYEVSEVDNEDSTVYEQHAVSYREALSKICTLLGYTLKYRGDIMYFAQHITKDADTMLGSYCNVYLTDFMNGNFSNSGMVASSFLFSSLTWSGAGHTRTINAGARSVAVVAKLEKADFRLELPDMPLTEADENNVKYGKDVKDGEYVDNMLYSLSLASYDFANNFHTNKYAVKVVITKNKSGVNYVLGNITTTKYNGMISSVDDPLSFGTNTNLSVTIQKNKLRTAVDEWNMYTHEEMYNVYAHSAKLEVYNVVDGKKMDFDNGLFVVGAFYKKYDSTTPMLDPDAGNYVARITSNSQLVCMNGILLLRFDALFLNAYGVISQYVNMDANYPSLIFALKCGDKWYHPMSLSWSTSFAYTGVYLQDGKIFHNIHIDNVDISDGYPVRVTPDIVGAVELYVYPHVYMNGQPKSPSGDADFRQMHPFYFFLKDLSLEYRPLTYATKSDKSENKYLINIGKFRDDVSVEVDYASDNNNQYSPSIIRVETEGSMVAEQLFTWLKPPMKDIARYYNMRPEMKLLQALKRYYEKKRETLTLEVALTAAQARKTAIAVFKKEATDTRGYVVLRDEWNVREDRHTIDLWETEVV